MDHKKFIYKKVQYLEDGCVIYIWYLINRKDRNAVQFHGNKTTKQDLLMSLANRHGFFTYGIEYHSTKPLYLNHTPLDNCEITGGVCYCDGSSLYASERLGYVDPDNNNHEDDIWAVLHDTYKSRFGDGE